jgi:hypothetical protein
MRLFGRRERDPQHDESAKPGMWRLGFVSGILAFASVLVAVAYVAQIWIVHRMVGVDPPRTIGTPLRMPAGDAAGVFLLSVQEETRQVGSRRWGVVRFEQVTHIDLWRFDVASAQPVCRRRSPLDFPSSAAGVIGRNG